MAAALGLVGTAAGKWADNAIERTKQQTMIILKASEVPGTLSPQAQEIQRARNLLWFATWDYLPLPDNLIQDLKEKASLQQGQPIPPPVIQSQGIPTSAVDLLRQLEGNTPTAEELKIANAAIDNLVKVPLSENQRAALISFVVNVGSGTFVNSTLLKVLNSGNYAEVPNEMRRWVQANGQLFPGLAQRREKEIEVWNKQP
jgi:hypothetical protein